MTKKLLDTQYKKALDLVAVLFKDEKRKITNVPYIVHLVSVAHVVTQATDNEDAVVAALLHDTLEDIPSEIYSESDMKKDYGEKVVALVKTVTHNEEKDGYAGSRQTYLKQVKNGSNSACLISAADLLHNLTDSIESHEEFPEQARKLFVGERASIRKDFYSDRFEILSEKLGSDAVIIQELREVLSVFNKIQDQYLVK